MKQGSMTSLEVKSSKHEQFMPSLHDLLITAVQNINKLVFPHYITKREVVSLRKRDNQWLHYLAKGATKLPITKLSMMVDQGT